MIESVEFCKLQKQQFQMNISLDGETAAVLGQGNVALDVARILLTPVDILMVRS